MSSYTKIKIILTFLIAIVIGMLTYNFLQQYGTDVEVVVTKVEIKEREQITESMLELKKIRSKERNMFAKQATNNFKDLENSISKIKIPAGKVIDLSTDVVKYDGTSNEKDSNGKPLGAADISQSYFINADERLLAIKLSADAALNNMLKKGDYIDVLGSFENDVNLKSERETLVLAQRIEVHDVQVIRKEDKGKESQIIVLKLSLKQATDIVWMKQHGKIDLVLSSIKANLVPATPINQTTILTDNNEILD